MLASQHLCARTDQIVIAGGRTDFPLTGGQVSLVQARDGHDIQLSYSTNAGTWLCSAQNGGHENLANVELKTCLHPTSDPQSLADFQPLLPNVTHLCVQ